MKSKLIASLSLLLILTGCNTIETSPAEKQQLELVIDPILLEPVPGMEELVQTTNRCSVIPTTELPYKEPTE